MPSGRRPEAMPATSAGGKATVEHFTRAAANEFAPCGIVTGHRSHEDKKYVEVNDVRAAG